MKRFHGESVTPDPRARRVIGKARGSHSTIYTLDCGHEIARKLRLEPTMLICPKCPPAGGIGSSSKFGA